MYVLDVYNKNAEREEVCVIYLAHITEDKTKEQGIAAHLTETAQLAGDFAQAFACRGWGYGKRSV